MNAIRRFVMITTIASVFACTVPLGADCGDCYEQSCGCKIAPEWALGGLAVVAIVAVVLQNDSGGNTGHSH